MATVNALVLKHQQKKDGTFNVKIRLTHNRVSRYMDTQQYVTKKQLDKDFNIKDTFVSKPINLILEKLRDSIAKLEGRIDFFDCDNLLAFLKNEDKPIDFIAFSKEVVENLNNQARRGTSNNFKVISNSLVDYFKRDVVFITEINSLMLRSYEKYLLSPRVMIRTHRNGKGFKVVNRGLSQSGLYCHMRDLRWLFNMAREAYNNEDLGLIKIAHYPFKNYKLQKPPETRKRNIPVDAVIKIRDSESAKSHVRAELARDMFMLSFYMCGTNAIDFYYANESNINGDRFEYKRRKTKGKRKDEAFISLKIIDEARPLFEKYIGKLQSRFSTHVGFVTALSDGMRRLQALEAAMLGVTYYWARHTFATLARNTCRKSKDDIAQALNHVDEGRKTTDIYIEKDWTIVDEVQESVVNLLRNNVTDPEALSALTFPTLVNVKLPNTDYYNSSELQLISQIDQSTRHYIIAAKVETKEWIAPILRERKEFRGMKISVDWLSFENYLKYRLGGAFEDWEDFYERGEISTVKIYYMNKDNCDASLATLYLNDSRYLKQSKFKSEFERIIFENEMFKWVEI